MGWKISSPPKKDGGEGISWYEHPSGSEDVRVPWRRHFVVDANFTKAFARDLDQDGDVDFIGTGEGYQTGDFGWYQRTDSGYTLHEFDIAENENDVAGGHNCDLVDVDSDGDEDLIVGGVDKRDGKQRFRWVTNVRRRLVKSTGRSTRSVSPAANGSARRTATTAAK